jgi:hypothetical protein
MSLVEQQQKKKSSHGGRNINVISKAATEKEIESWRQKY